MIVLTKMGSATHMANLVKSIATKVMEEGGCVRNITNLGDRILPKTLRMQDTKHTAVARYLAFQVDASPELKDKTLQQAMEFGDVIRAVAHKMKEETYITEVQRRLLQQTSPFTLEEHKSSEVIQDLYNYVETYNNMSEEFKNPKKHYLKHKPKLTGDFFSDAKRTEQYRRFASGDADSLDYYK